MSVLTSVPKTDKEKKMIYIKSKREIELMKEACRITALAHKAIAEAIRPGISTLELDKIAEKVIRDDGGIPAEIGYPSY